MNLERGPAYRIQTPRLQIRCYQPSDALSLKSSIDANLEHLRPWMPWAHDEPTPLEVKRAFLRRTRGRFDLDVDLTYGVFDPSGVEVRGGTGLHDRVGEGAREIGYWIDGRHGGQGLATEVAGALTRVGFEVMGLDRIEIRCDPDNHPSARVAVKLGYTDEGLRRGIDRDVRGIRRDTRIFTMLREEYPGSPAREIPCQAFDVCDQPFPELGGELS